MRALAWKRKNGHRVKGCSDCSWTFEPKDSPRGGNIQEMMDEFNARQQKEFEAHVCTKEPK